MDCPGMSVKVVMRRLERERDIARSDVERLQEERDALRERLRLVSGTQVAEHARLEKTYMECETRVHNLEVERRELMTCQGSRRATITHLEEQCETFRDQLRTAQAELSQQRALCSQIKTLQDQTDRALAESQGQQTQIEMQLNNAQERIRDLERDRAVLDREVASLKNERIVLRGSLAQVEQEKVNLIVSSDKLTERVAMLEQELKAKDNQLLTMEDALMQSQTKLELAVQDSCAKEEGIRNYEREINSLNQDLEVLEKARDNMALEVRRLQVELSDATKEMQEKAEDLETAQKAIDNMNARISILSDDNTRMYYEILNKEERAIDIISDMRRLRHRLMVLSDKHRNLQTDMNEALTQIHSYEERVADLEQQLRAKDALLREYEGQKTELIEQVDRLEQQLQQYTDKNRRTDADLMNLKQNNNTLDAHREGLVIQVANLEANKRKMESDMRRLLDEQEKLKDQVTKDKSTIDSLEQMVAASRREAMECKLAKKDLQIEVERLSNKEYELNEKINKDINEMQKYSSQSAELSRPAIDPRKNISTDQQRATISQSGPSYAHDISKYSVDPPHPIALPSVQPVGIAPSAPPPSLLPRDPTQSNVPRRSREWPSSSRGGVLGSSLTGAPASGYTFTGKSVDWGASLRSSGGSYAIPARETWGSRRFSQDYRPMPLPPGPQPLNAQSQARRAEDFNVKQPNLYIHPTGDHTVHCTFTSSGAPIVSCNANYTVVRRNGTETTTATQTLTSPQDGPPPSRTAPPPPEQSFRDGKGLS